MPEGAMYYGPLWNQLFAGLLEGLRAGRGQGDVHVFCEGTYSLRDPEAIRDHAQAARVWTAAKLDGEAREIWDQRGRIALGAWPLGYYQAVKDSAGRLIGFAARGQLAGEVLEDGYGDKGARYPIEEFRTQLAAIRTFSDRYCFIYGHGASWWQINREQADRYAKKVAPLPRNNYMTPTVTDIDRYYAITKQAETVRFTGE
jgi:hypothetical protein